MPEVAVYFYKEKDGSVPFKIWLQDLALKNAKAWKKCVVYLKHLQREGHTLRRPTADFLRDGVYELRPTFQGVHFRIL